MAGWDNQDKKRNVIPRWRDLSQTAALGELAPLKRASKSELVHPSDFLDKKKVDWTLDRTVKNSIELLNSSIVIGDDESLDQIVYYLDNHSFGESKIIRSLLDKVTNAHGDANVSSSTHSITDLDKVIGEKIKKCRINIHRNPFNAVSWIELARLYLIVGKNDTAERCVLTAIHLSPHNRYVSRVAARFFVHATDYNKARQILRFNSAFNLDPWLIGAEIGISSLQNKSSLQIRKGRDLMGSKNYSSFELSELVSALATEELISGSVKNSRKLFNQSLIQPNDNTLAQAVWAVKHVSNIEVFDKKFDSIPSIYEASAYAYYNTRQWEPAMLNILEWFIDQPFSIDPSTLGSFIASSILERYDDAIKLCRVGLRATPDNFTLMNNLAFSLLGKGKPEEARKVLSKISVESLPNEEKVVFYATKGLLMYKLGLSTSGAALYDASSSLAEKIKSKKLKLLSEFHHLVIQLETEGYPDHKFLKFEQFAREIGDKNEIFFNDLVNNVIRRRERFVLL